MKQSWRCRPRRVRTIAIRDAFPAGLAAFVVLGAVPASAAEPAQAIRASVSATEVMDAPPARPAVLAPTAVPRTMPVRLRLSDTPISLPPPSRPPLPVSAPMIAAPDMIVPRPARPTLWTAKETMADKPRPAPDRLRVVVVDRVSRPMPRLAIATWNERPMKRPE